MTLDPNEASSFSKLNMERDPGDISNFSRLGGVEVQTATSSDDFVKNVKFRTKQGHKKLSDLPEFGVIKGHSNPIALVGGGPSLEKEIERLKDFQLAGFPVIACGSSHDYLVSKGIIPDYCSLCDPDAITGEYVKKHSEKTKYLVALSCDGSVFDRLKDREIYVWNCRSDEAAEHLQEDLHGHIDILGGCTVGLRSISIAMAFGYTNIHFWGFDSCMGSGNEHHAYKFETDKEEIGTVYPIRFGDSVEGKPDPDGKYYMCAGYQLAQAMHFHQFIQVYGAAFTPTFHGEGLLGDYYAFLRRKAEQYNTKIVTSESIVSKAA